MVCVDCLFECRHPIYLSRDHMPWLSENSARQGEGNFTYIKRHHTGELLIAGIPATGNAAMRRRRSRMVGIDVAGRRVHHRQKARIYAEKIWEILGCLGLSLSYRWVLLLCARESRQQIPRLPRVAVLTNDGVKHRRVISDDARLAPPGRRDYRRIYALFSRCVQSYLMLVRTDSFQEIFYFRSKTCLL